LFFAGVNIRINHIKKAAQSHLIAFVPHIIFAEELLLQVFYQ